MYFGCINNALGTTKECVAAAELIRSTCAVRFLSGTEAAMDHPVVRYDMGTEDMMLGKLPTSSVVAQEACINAIIEEICNLKLLTYDEFRKNHPA